MEVKNHHQEKHLESTIRSVLIVMLQKKTIHVFQNVLPDGKLALIRDAFNAYMLLRYMKTIVVNQNVPLPTLKIHIQVIETVY